MSFELDEGLRRLRSAPPDRDFAALDGDVWNAVAARELESARAAAARPFAAMGVTGALVFGVLAGGVGGTEPRQPSELAVFSPRSALAPSTLLGG